MHRLVAALVGAAIAIGATGLFVNEPSADHAAAGSRLRTPSPFALSKAEMVGSSQKPIEPGGHLNATTDSDATPLLNPHFLVGKATTICTNEPTLVEPLKDAIKAWESAIGNVGFDVIANPETCVSPDVRVDLVNHPRCTNPCYLKMRKTTRDIQVFKFDGVAPALIAYPTSTPIRVSTLIHEVGHALGLPDYNDSADPTMMPTST